MCLGVRFGCGDRERASFVLSDNDILSHFFVYVNRVYLIYEIFFYYLFNSIDILYICVAGLYLRGAALYNIIVLKYCTK